jgi:hypothetical protein
MEQDQWVRVQWLVEVEGSVQCHTEAMVHMRMGCGDLIIQPRVVIHFMEGHLMDLFSA